MAAVIAICGIYGFCPTATYLLADITVYSDNVHAFGNNSKKPFHKEVRYDITQTISVIWLCLLL